MKIKSLDIPCRGYLTDYGCDGHEFDCGYENSCEFECGECVCNFGHINPIIRISDNLMFETPLLCIGVDDVVEIKYHEPQGEGDKHFVDVLFESGAIVRCFDVINIQFGEKEK